MKGALTLASALPDLNQDYASTRRTNALGVAIHPTARVAVTAAFSINKGILTPASSPVATGRYPFGTAFDPTSGLGWRINKVDSEISGLAVNTMSGALIPVPNTPISSVGSAPVGIFIFAKQ